MAFAPAPEYQVFPQGPEPLDFYEAVVHADARHAAARARAGSRRRRRGHPHARAGARRGDGGRRWATLIPHVYPHGRPDSRSTRSARGCRAARPDGRCGGARTRSCSAGSSGAGASSTRRGRGSGCRRSTTSTAASAASSRSWARSRSSSTRGDWPEHVHVVGPLMWEPPAEQADALDGLEAELAVEDERPLVLIATSTAQDARAPAAARRAPRAWPTRRCA